MKLYIILILLISSVNINGQSIFSDNLEWFFTSRSYNLTTGVSHSSKYSVQLKKDTTINNLNHKQLFIKRSENEGYLPSDLFLKRINDTILLVNKNNGREIIEYIENLLVSQRIEFSPSPFACIGVVKNLDSIESCGNKYATTEIEILDKRKWIKGVGSDFGMFTSNHCAQDVATVHLNCVYENGIKIFQSNDNIDCSGHFLSSLDKSEIKELVVFPNPTNNLINFNNEVNRIMIFNLNGKLLDDQIINANYFQTNNLINGIYFLKLTTESNQSTIVKFIKS